jgi:hypothetical protein
MSELEALSILIGGYLDQNWLDEYGDLWVAVEAFVRWEPELAPLVHTDIEMLVEHAESDREVERRLATFGLGFAPTNAGWSSYGAWLRAVAERVDQILHKSPAA